MSHLVLVNEDTAVDPEVEGSDLEQQDSDEQRPLLRHEDTDGSTSSSQREGAKVTTNYSLVPDATLPAQVKRHDAVRLKERKFKKEKKLEKYKLKKIINK